MFRSCVGLFCCLVLLDCGFTVQGTGNMGRGFMEGRSETVKDNSRVNKAFGLITPGVSMYVRCPAFIVELVAIKLRRFADAECFGKISCS